jgi:NifB/MoaA-like Fe-S oxidoreductase
MVEKIKGEIESVSVDEKKKKYGIKIGGVWYNGKGSTGLKKGDMVEVEFNKNKEWNNISQVNVIGRKIDEKQGTIDIDILSVNPKPTQAEYADIDKKIEILAYIMKKLDEKFPSMEPELKKDMAISILIDFTKKENIDIMRKR